MRSSGIIMHISSLPSPYGIGTLGQAAFSFVDFLAKAGQSYWQILPIGPTGCGNSPYQSFSAFAGNPHFIDLDILIENGLLEKSEVTAEDWYISKNKVDFGKLNTSRFRVLKQAHSRFKACVPCDYHRFLAENGAWLQDYALFMALRDKFDCKCWTEWGDAKFYEYPIVDTYREKLKEDIDFYCFLQYEFFRQWKELQKYAQKRGIKIIGDVPIYVPLDSADVWSKPELFRLDKDRNPTGVAGCPPDYFTEDGQLWGNPLYDWDKLEKYGYAWWVERIKAVGKLCDVIRLDHFRGFASYWDIPYGDETARFGKWVDGPGESFITALKKISGVRFIAEDLGILTPDVIELQKFSGFPGMKILQFAFDPSADSDYLPHNYNSNHCVCYTGTHDNATLCQWLSEAPENVLTFARQYLGLNENEGYCRGIIRGGMSSVAELFMAQMQDYLELGKEGRMNLPGTISDSNWCWRAMEEQLSDTLADDIYRITNMYARTPKN